MACAWYNWNTAREGQLATRKIATIHMVSRSRSDPRRPFED